MVAVRSLKYELDGYGSMVSHEQALAGSPDTTTEDYAQDQLDTNEEKTRNFLIPLLERTGGNVVLDVGCGVGKSVAVLQQEGYDAYGVDLAGLTRFWARGNYARDRFYVIDPVDFRMPFEDESFDLAFSIGAIEHVGTRDGHADLRPDYVEMRRRWLAEVFRTVRRGGYLLMGGPNRTFPIDVAHGLDPQASGWERWLSARLGATVHRTRGNYFLWSYGDIRKYLGDLPYRMEVLRVTGLLNFSRVWGLARPLARFYVNRLPGPLLGTGLNPWTLALIKRL